jgi:hypothetical protein
MRLRLACALSLVVACSSSAANDAPKCGGASPQKLTTADRDTLVVVAGEHVYVGGPSTPELSRFPLAGGPREVIDANGRVQLLAANESKTVVWARRPAALVMRDEAGTETELSAPSDAGAPQAIAIDAANHVFVLSSTTGGSFSEMLWRWDPARKTADVLYRARGGTRGPWRDGRGVAWVGAGNAGSSLYHEDVEGGDPHVGPALPPDGDVVGLDDRSIYTARNGGPYGKLTFNAIDRASGASSVALETEGTAYAPTFAVDDTSFYWLIQRSDGATLTRAPKGTQQPEVLASEPRIGRFGAGGCSLAYVAETRADGADAWSVFVRAK